MKQRKIGEKFQHEGVWLEVVEPVSCCDGCYFFDGDCKAVNDSRIDCRRGVFIKTTKPNNPRKGGNEK